MKDRVFSISRSRFELSRALALECKLASIYLASAPSSSSQAHPPPLRWLNSPSSSSSYSSPSSSSPSPTSSRTSKQQPHRSPTLVSEIVRRKHISEAQRSSSSRCSSSSSSKFSWVPVRRCIFTSTQLLLQEKPLLPSKEEFQLFLSSEPNKKPTAKMSSSKGKFLSVFISFCQFLSVFVSFSLKA